MILLHVIRHAHLSDCKNIGSRKVVEDSDDDEEAPPPKAPTPKAKPQKEQYRPLSRAFFSIGL